MATSPFLSAARPAATAPARPAPRPRADADAPERARPVEVLLWLLVVVALFAGWRVRDEEHLTAQSGVGYALGIAGTVAMLALLLYPLRKHLRIMRNLGAVKHWFRAHMILGVVGPALVLLHANFHIRSLNGAVAIASMLLVVGSGFVGRYLYAKVHYGLYGRRLTLTELTQALQRDLGEAALLLGHAPELRQRLLAFDAVMLAPCPNLLQGFWRVATAGARTRWSRLRLLRGLERAVEVAARAEQWSPAERRRRREAARRCITAHLVAARRVARFSFYERLFALWHLLHTPLFVMLLVTVAVHVIAVHLY